MNKSIYDKWQELLDLRLEDNKIVISNYFLSISAKTKLYIGRSSDSQFLYLEFEQNILDNVELPELKGLEITLSLEANIDKSKQYIKIRNRTDNIELFIAFSSSLCDAVVDTTDYYSAFAALESVIKEYRSFFSKENKSLSLKEEQGLCAELLELKRLIELKGEDIVRTWAGPSRNKRDFLLGSIAIEVKSTLGQIDPSIHISNENQLTHTFPYSLTNLFLKVYILEKSTEGFDVNSCANEIMSLFKNVNNKSFFMVNLLRAKIDLNTYKSKYHFSLQKTNQYEIIDGFPKITKDILPAGVFSVEYRIHLDAIRDFKVSEEALYGKL